MFDNEKSVRASVGRSDHIFDHAFVCCHDATVCRLEMKIRTNDHKNHN